MIKKNLVVVLDNVRSGNNVGSFFRTCDALGVSRLVLCGITGTPPAAEVRKTALGAEDVVPWEWVASTVEVVRKLQEEGYVVMAVEQVSGAVMLQDFVVDAASRYALVFGNEVDGVALEVIAACDGAVEIPQCGVKKSLNVAVAGGIAIYKWSMVNLRGHLL